MSQFLRRLRYLLNYRRLDRELANDMEFHREMAEADGIRNFGNPLRLREASRDAWGWTWVERVGQDLRYAFRLFSKSPGFTFIAVAILAIGIGVNVAAFSFFDLLVLRPLHVREPATLFRFHRRSPQQFAFVLPFPETEFFSQQSRTLSAVLTLNAGHVAAEGEEKQSSTNFVSGNFFSELGAPVLLGRAFHSARGDSASDDSKYAPPVVILSQGFWNRHFGADPSVIGRRFRLNGKPATIIGVASDRFSGLSLDPPDLWIPIQQQPYFSPGSLLLTDFSADGSGVEMWGRLQPGVSPKAAEQELTSLAAQLRPEHPGDIWDRETIPGEPGGFAKSLMIGGRRGSGFEGNEELYPVTAMIGVLCLMILAVACSNLGSLLLARGMSREREMSIRAAVGAGRARLIRQLFTESVLLALLGSVAGLALGYLTLRSLLVLTDSPAWLDPIPDWRIMLFSVAMGFVAALLFGLAPALQVVQRRHRTSTMRHVLVAAQVAASCVLVILASLLVRALEHATSADPGFEYQRVLTIDPGLATHGYTPAQARSFLDTLTGRLQAIPGVDSVSLALSPPLGNRSEMAGIALGKRRVDIQINRVDPHFFQTMHIPLLGGRNLTRGDMHRIIISESLARRWPTGDPLGKTFSMGEEYTVIGIAGSARAISIENSDAVEVYLPIEDADLPSVSVVLKASTALEPIARSAVVMAKTIDPQVSPDVQLLRSQFKRKLHGAEYSALTVSLLGFVALFIACLGIVGLVAFTVAQRTREIGIRMALGAKPFQVVASIVQRFSPAVGFGLVVGVGSAAALSQILRRELYGISNLDPLAYFIAITVFGFTVALSAFVAARRALLVDPVDSLRHE